MIRDLLEEIGSPLRRSLKASHILKPNLQQEHWSSGEIRGPRSMGTKDADRRVLPRVASRSHRSQQIQAEGLAQNLERGEKVRFRGTAGIEGRAGSIPTPSVERSRGWMPGFLTPHFDLEEAV